MTLRSAEEHYRRQGALAAAVTRRVDRLWRQVGGDDVNAWSDLLPQVSTLVAAGQVNAASAADAYVTRALAEQESLVAPEVDILPVGFAAMANGPVSVLDLLDLPRIQTLERIGDGMMPVESLERGRAQVTMFAASLIQDAGRQAVGLGIYARPTVGWRRMVNPPCCERCAILAGKWFRSNQGFDRHPRCDCTHVPAREAAPGDVSTDPVALFGSGQVRGLKPDEARAISNGADPLQVINARRGSSGMFTTEGTSRRGVAGRTIRADRPGVRRVARPTPEAIYANAANRDDALTLLRQNGYIRS